MSLNILAGEMVMLVGPSGSGKTTLLSIMGCILRPTSGRVLVQGREVGGLSEAELSRVRLQNIGFIFQGFNLFPALNARENVELALDLQDIRGGAARRRAFELLQQVGLGGQQHNFPADLSMGQKQRVAVARALAGDPEIILADEPTASLDAHSGREVMELLRDLATHRNRAVVVVTHDNRVLEFADRIVHLQDGTLSEEPMAHIVEPAVRS